MAHPGRKIPPGSFSENGDGIIFWLLQILVWHFDPLRTENREMAGIEKFEDIKALAGFTAQDQPIHILCGMKNPTILIIVTVYRPDPDRWIDWRIRKG